jgi:type II secretory pathway component PulK
MVGLQAGGGDIRILGAAAVMYPGFAANDAFKKMETFRQGLPVSAVLPGFILAAVNIATANGFFDAHPNRNVNTMSQAELQAVVPNAAAAIVEGRKSPNNGFATMQDVTSLLQPKGLAANLDQLTTDYPKPDTW